MSRPHLSAMLLNNCRTIGCRAGRKRQFFSELLCATTSTSPHQRGEEPQGAKIRRSSLGAIFVNRNSDSCLSLSFLSVPVSSFHDRGLPTGSHLTWYRRSRQRLHDSRGYRWFMLFHSWLPALMVLALGWLPRLIPHHQHPESRLLARTERHLGLRLPYDHTLWFGCLLVIFILSVHWLVVQTRPQLPRPDC
jgi:hypothetical protein